MDCRPAFDAAVEACRGSGPGCRILLAPGYYPASCPAGAGAFLRGAPAVNLTGTQGLTFGGSGSNGGDAPVVAADYNGTGCPVIGAENAESLTLRDVVVDTVRATGTEGVVLSATSKRIVMSLPRPVTRFSFDVERYPWVRQCYSCNPLETAIVANFTRANMDASAGTVTLEYDSPFNFGSLVGQGVLLKHWNNLPAWGVYGWRVADMALERLTMHSVAGMGIRCDFCRGDYVLRETAVRPGANLTMSSTADGVHLMHHRGTVTLDRVKVLATHDDCFNVHGNYVVLSEILGSERRSATYIDETGPGWVTALPLMLVEDLAPRPVRVGFFNRKTLQRIGGDNYLVSATGGFGPNATVRFRDPIPAGVRRYDMFLSLDHVANVTVDRSVFAPQRSRGTVLSGVDISITDSNFTFGFSGGAAMLFMQGGCGAYNDYTEGPVPDRITITGNRVTQPSTSTPWKAKNTMRGAIMLMGCMPEGTCNASAPPTEPYPMPTCEPGATIEPPVVSHESDPGPGRITENGFPLSGPGVEPIYPKVVIENNFIMLNGSTPLRFIDIGVARSISMRNNTAQRADEGHATPDICVYESNFEAKGDAWLSNRCEGSSGEPRPCTFHGTLDGCGLMTQ